MPAFRGSTFRSRLPALLLLALSVPPAFAASTRKSRAADEHLPTAAAVRAVDRHWLEAEVSGDVAYLDHLLLPEYRSVDVVGVVTDKAGILAHAARNRGSDAMRRKVEAWQKLHPSKSTVVLHGDVAIVSFHVPAKGPRRGLRSSDVFVHDTDGWHALYSQHSQPRED